MDLYILHALIGKDNQHYLGWINSSAVAWSIFVWINSSAVAWSML
jgi:hypothetical protein